MRMAERVRALDWSTTPLGPIDQWPHHLRSGVSICLDAGFPIALYWGPEFTLVYNDAWVPIPGDKHPWALGRPAREVWPEIWDVIGPSFGRVMATGEAIFAKDELFLLRRHGYVEECYFDYSLGPVRESGGAVGGLFNTALETTARVLSERRTRLLRGLAEHVTPARSSEEACALAAETFASAVADVPFSILYLVPAEGRRAILAGVSGLAAGTAASPLVVDLAESDGGAWPLGKAARRNEPELVSELPGRFGRLPGGPWPDPAGEALVLPIATNGKVGVAGFLIAGVSPRRALDRDYREFFELAAGQIATAIANAQAHQRKRGEVFVAGQSRILEMIATSAALGETLATLIGLIESQAAGMFCSVLLLDEDGVHMRHGAAPSLPEAYSNLIDGICIGPSVGSCGTAMYRGEPVFVTDILHDPLWADYCHLAAAHGLRACWSTPIFSSQREVLGSFAMYYREPRSPSLVELELISLATHIAGIAIERKRAEEALRRSEADRKLALDGGRLGEWKWEIATGDVTWSPQCKALYGLTADAKMSYDSFLAAVHPDDRARVAAAIAQAVETRSDYDLEKRIVWPDGSVHWNASRGRVYCDAAGQPLRMAGVTMDITDRKHGEEALRASLREKEALLKEVHHRVKNNLQLISSLLSLQAARVADPVARELLADSRNRVRSMALVHEKLYRSGSLARIPLAIHVHDLCSHLFHSYGVDESRITFEVHIGDVTLDLDRAIPCVLIVSELVSNALRHAFPGGRIGCVSVGFDASPGGSCALTVADDGVGMPEGLDLGRTDSLGLQLVGDLAHQIHGTVAISRKAGTTFVITFNADAGGGPQA